jgi:glycosyltransferase involved in cell wall biosynthesis
MDGIEWKRAKWTTPLRIWFWLNERFGCWLGNHLIADHPEIMRHLETRTSTEKLTMIPYGADRIEAADSSMLDKFGLSPNGYAILIARAEPENSILEVVRAFSRAKRNIKLVILGTYDPSHAYQKCVLESAGAEVMFVGAIYDTRTVAALRYFSRLYIHGHQVGGTNPSLVEALGAGNAVLAHSNQFNRWVAGNGARYFSDENECAGVLDQILNNETILQAIRKAATTRYQERFTWDRVLQEYESLLLQWLPAPSQSSEQTGE